MRAFFSLLLILSAFAAVAAERPNFLWIVSEDNSHNYLKLYDEQGAETPNIERLARQGLLFEHAFSNAPVCSVARTTLATSVYAPRLGTQFHRKLAAVKLPPDWKLFQEYLHEAGYYTSNNSKTDYNVQVKPAEVWDACSNKASWRNRAAGQPFFHMESHGTSHESSLHFDQAALKNAKTRTDPAGVRVWPYFPDTRLFQYTTARYHDKIQAIDEIVGKRIAELEEAGLLDDTFIFYFGDHGGVLPGSKGYVWERGLHVPLVVSVPKDFRHLLDDALKPGTRVQGFVEFVDFGPTLLNLAGLEVPRHMDGTPFLGKNITLNKLNQRNEAFGYADRFDEKYELVRSLRQGRYKYLRFFQGYYPDGLQNNYRYNMLAYQQWRKMFQAGELNEQQSQFFQPKPAEALYDLQADPHELKNLAGDPAHQQTLLALRKRLRLGMQQMPDLSLYPETVLVSEAVSDPFKFGQEHQQEIIELLEVADLALLPFDQAQGELAKALQSDNRWVRYWAATACAQFGDAAKPLAETAKKLLDDEELLVRVRAAEFLGRIRAADPVPVLKSVLQQSDSHVTTLIALGSVVYLQDVLGYKFDLAKSDIKTKGGEVSRRIEYLIP